MKQITKPNWKLLTIIFCIVGGLIGIAVIIAMAANRTNNGPYCQSVDPTGCEVQVRIYNDTDSTFSIKQCVGDFFKPQCKKFGEEIILEPGQDHSAIGATSNDPPQPWAVFDRNNKNVGCLDLHFTDGVKPPVIAPLSHLISCERYL
jgi:hypothetical protein